MPDNVHVIIVNLLDYESCIAYLSLMVQAFEGSIVSLSITDVLRVSSLMLVHFQIDLHTP